jgi:EAL domain-containing protein (putative c-di-GMP-specific phosphodiesterase class I)
LRVVAEGVATREQFEFLGARGCHAFQGFWISKALPADEFVAFNRARPERRQNPEKRARGQPR